MPAVGAREAELLVAVDDGHVLGTVTWCPPDITRGASSRPRPDQAEFRMLRWPRLGAVGAWARALVKACSGSGASRGDA